MKVGDILLYKTNGIFGKIINFGNLIHYGKFGYSHAAIVGEIFPTYCVVYEAKGKGFIKSNYDIDAVKADNNIDVYSPIRSVSKVKEHAEKYLGKPYGWLDILHIVLYIVFGKKSFTLDTGAKSIICSEAVARILYDASHRKINIAEEMGKRYDLITPQDLANSKMLRNIYK